MSAAQPPILAQAGRVSSVAPSSTRGLRMRGVRRAPQGPALHRPHRPSLRDTVSHFPLSLLNSLPFPASLTPTKRPPLLLLLLLVPRPAPLSVAGEGRRWLLRLRVWQESLSSQAAGAATSCGAGVSHAGRCCCY